MVIVFVKWSFLISCFVISSTHALKANRSNATDKLSECSTYHDCVRCNPSGCIKCSNLIVFPTRECVDTCPLGFTTQWSRLVDYMGQMCINTSNHIYGFTSETFAIILGTSLGLILCIVFIIFGLMYRRFCRPKDSNGPVTLDSFTDDGERLVFLKQLELFRPHAYTFLDMLNDTRRQIRELNQLKLSGLDGTITQHENSPTLIDCNRDVNAYKRVVCDLAKILVLLNRHPDAIAEVPADWERLFLWGDKLLKRYNRITGSGENTISCRGTNSSSSGSQVAQLIDFLQGSNEPFRDSQSFNSRLSPDPKYSTLSTFKPDSLVTSRSSIDTVTDQVPLDTIPIQTFAEDTFGWAKFPEQKTWDHSREYLSSGCWFEGNLATSQQSQPAQYYLSRLGSRPQDEITTEL